MEGLSSKEACNVLGISEINQRVLLHRGRARLRAALERHLTVGGSAPDDPRENDPRENDPRERERK